MTIEATLTSPLEDYALEQLRARFIHSVTTTHDAVVGAKVAVQMAFATEIRATLVKLMAPEPSTLAAVFPARRRFLDVDVDLRSNKFLIEPALDSLSSLLVPEPYVNLLRRYLGSDYPRYRVCAVAATLCLAARQLQDT